MIPCLNDALMGHTSYQESEFLPEESEARFKQNLLSQPYNWIYRTEKIYYKFNKHGHRCVDIDQLEQDYFLFAGCSFTEGVGLKLERTYPYIVSQHFNRSYYNISLGGSGPDVTLYNLIGFLSQVKHKPNLVIIQWPDFSRFFHMDKKFYPHYYNSHDSSELYKLLVTDDVIERQNLFYREYALQFLKNLGITNVLEYTTQKDYNTVKLQMPAWIDKARDLSHPGNLTHQSWANSLINTIDKNFAHVLKM